MKIIIPKLQSTQINSQKRPHFTGNHHNSNHHNHINVMSTNAPKKTIFFYNNGKIKSEADCGSICFNTQISHSIPCNSAVNNGCFCLVLLGNFFFLRFRLLRFHFLRIGKCFYSTHPSCTRLNFQLNLF